DEWMTADLLALKRDANDLLQRVAPQLYQRLVVDRNRRWADRLAERMGSRGRIVVVVGIGHLVGPDGLPALLRARGLAVEGPT
ncbi:MAG TPA: TraB/GumN family protein, partial [Caulobacteraceae bacterium]